VLWDLGRAAQNIILAAWAMGIGSCPITVQDFELAADVLGLPADRQCQYIIALGWPQTRRPLRRQGRWPQKFDEVVHAERW
jgi:nitroreductase